MDKDKRLFELSTQFTGLDPAIQSVFLDSLKEDNRQLAHARQFEWGGLLTGAAIGVLGLWLSYLLIKTGNPASAAGGAAVGVADFVALVRIFVYGTRKQAAAEPAE